MPTAVSGARAKFIVNGTEVGWATGIQGTETVDVIPIAVLGEVDVQEHEVVGRSVNFSAAFVRILDEPLTLAGGETALFPTGDDSSTGADHPVNFARDTKLQVVVFDDINENAIYTFENVKPTSRSFTVDRGGIMATNATFVATRMKDNLTS